MSKAARVPQSAITMVPLIVVFLFAVRFYRKQEREQERVACQAMALAERLTTQLGEEQFILVKP